MTALPPGLYPVMLTPFTESNELDLDGLRALTRFYLQAGANGLFANCLSSEMFQLTSEERLLITKTVVEATDGQVPVLSTGTFSTDAEVNADFIKKIYDVGVQAVVINTNQLAASWASEAVFKTKVEELLHQTDAIPLGLYECPVPYKRLLSPDLMSWLGRTGRFLYLKETSCDELDIQEKIKAVKDTPLAIFDAHTPNAITSLRAGAKGLSAIGANFYPELYTYLLNHLDSDENIELLQANLTLMDAIIDQDYLWSAKYFLQQRGLPIRLNSRKPMPHITRQSILKLDAVQTVFEKLCSDFGIEKVSLA